MKIAVLMGGISSEREISLKTGGAILNSLLRMGYDAFELRLNEENMLGKLQTTDFDLAFIALHGEFGEDGRIQAVLDILKKEYTGSKYLASAIAMDKEITKKILEAEGILVPKTYEKLNKIKEYPVIVKPALEGSSVGLYVCKNEREVKEALKKIKNKKILIEEYIKGEELTVGVLNEKGLGVVKIIPKSGIYDYESKYTKGKTVFEVPAKIEDTIYKKALSISEEVYKILNLDGAIRVDYILKNGRLYFLEVNTIPGMTETSLLPKIAFLEGYTFDNLVEKIMEKVAKKKKK
ncbi:MAG: D-alanine--D-alanine ligase [Fusobacteriia bacterium 4572_132]|nr:MAG: D-alanine--D-alanine ligase [Fusobacteriia bacterium 4572_132]